VNIGHFNLKTALFSALIVIAALTSDPRISFADNSPALWNALRSGAAFAIMRHALAPGTGDPETVVIGDCTTQRNLSDTGRDQSREIGEKFRANGISAARVYTSAWCRCAETAELLNIGAVKVLPPLNSFFVTPDRAVPQTAALTNWLAKNKADAPLVLVTHQVNITALTEVYPRSGEIVVARLDGNGNIRVLGTIYVPDRR
jgi:8-oxo-(d)GTP phosphatase